MKNIIVWLKDKFMRREFVKFLVVGSLNTLFSSAVYLLLLFVLPYKIAYSLSYFAGLIFSYFLNTKWVFQAAVNTKSFFAFPLVYVPQYLISIVCLHILVEKFAMSEQVSFLVVIVLSIPVTFLLSRLIIKR